MLKTDNKILYLKSMCEFCSDRRLLYPCPVHQLAILSKPFPIILYYYALFAVGETLLLRFTVGEA